jgi:tRNA (guanine37-N1)-methyltransferase
MKTFNTPHLSVGVISLFPEMFEALNFGVTGRAIKRNLMDLSLWNLRDFSTDKHRTVDDRPFGGGPGMVLKTEPLRAALKQAKRALGDNALIVYLSPQGKKVDQAMLNRLIATPKPIIMLAGRYEGIDERVIEADIDEEWSLGDLVLSGGELAAMSIIDGLSRLIPGALGSDASNEEDSFMNGLLDHPHYTRPIVTEEGESVPSVLSSGDHQAIKTWRLMQSLGKTFTKRPDLLEKRQLSKIEQTLLDEYIRSNCNVDDYRSN